MKKIFYIIAVVLGVSWFLGYFALGAGTVIHTLLMTGMVVYLKGVICNDDVKVERCREWKDTGSVPVRE